MSDALTQDELKLNELILWLEKISKQGVPHEAKERYDVLGQYEILLRFVAECPEERAFLVYDAFAILLNNGEHQDDTPLRGFYIDLWDIWIREGQPGAQHGIVATLLRSSLTTMAPGLLKVLSTEDGIDKAGASVCGLDRWVDELDLLIIAPPKNDTSGVCLRSRWRLFRALAHLYGTAFPRRLREQGFAALNHQVDAVREQLDGRAGDVARASGTGVRPISAVLALMVSHMTFPFNEKVLDCLLKRIDEPRTPDLTRMLKHWGAGSKFVELVLSELGFKYEHTRAWAPGNLTAPRGCDLFVAVVGSRRVGKTHFLFATEAASTPDSSIRKAEQDGTNPAYPPEFEVRSLIEGKAGDDAIEALRSVWREGLEIDEERDAKGFVTDTAHAMGHTQSQRMTRLHYLDIPGEWVANSSRTTWLEKYFKSQQPRALVLLVDDRFKPDQAQDYRSAIRLFQSVLENPVPVYVVLNKSDRALNRATSADLREELRRHLDAEESVMTGDYSLPFLSTRGLDPAQVGFEGLRRFVLDSRPCCASLVFQEQLLRDLDRLAPIVNELCKPDSACGGGSEDITFVYTTSLNNSARRRPIQVFWRDMHETITKATQEDRVRWFRQRFITEAMDDEKRLKSLDEQRDNQPRPRLDTAEFGRLIEDQERLKTDWDAVYNVCPADSRKIAWTWIAKSVSEKTFTPAEIASRLAEFRATRDKLVKWTELSLRLCLSELGIQPEMPLNKIRADPLANVRRNANDNRLLESLRPPRLVPEQVQTAIAAIHEVLSELVGQEVSDQQLSSACEAFFEVLGEIQKIPGANTSVAYNRQTGALETGCPFVDRALRASEVEALRDLKGETIAEALIYWAQGEAKLDKVRILLQLLMNLEHVRALSTSSKVLSGQTRSSWALAEVDETKRSVLADESLIALNYEAINAVTDAACKVLDVIRALHKDWPDSYFRTNYEDDASYLTSQYLVELLKSAGFRDVASTEFASRISKAYELAREIESSRFPGNKKRDDLDALMRDVEIGWAPDNNLPLGPIIRRLIAAGAAADEINKLAKFSSHSGQWKNFHEPEAVQDLQEKLATYVDRRKRALFRERIEYLKTSGWLSQDGQFLDQIVAAIKQPNASVDQLSADFKRGIENLLSNQGAWA